MIGFKVNTVRSSTPPGDKLEPIDRFTREYPSSNVFVVNMNTMPAGVNLHKHCHKGIIVNYTYNAKQLMKTFYQLFRVGQEKAVTWHILKVKGSFYDHQELISMMKWAKTLSTEANIPDWISGALREIVIFEVIKSVFGQPVNRYAWVIMREKDKEFHDKEGTFFDPHLNHVTKLGHVFSYIAKVILQLKDDQQEAWQSVEATIVEAALVTSYSMSLNKTLDRLIKAESGIDPAFTDTLLKEAQRANPFSKWNQRRLEEQRQRQEEVDTYELDPGSSPKDGSPEIRPDELLQYVVKDVRTPPTSSFAQRDDSDNVSDSI